MKLDALEQAGRYRYVAQALLPVVGYGLPEAPLRQNGEGERSARGGLRYSSREEKTGEFTVG